MLAVGNWEVLPQQLRLGNGITLWIPLAGLMSSAQGLFDTAQKLDGSQWTNPRIIVLFYCHFTADQQAPSPQGTCVIIV